MPVSPLRSPAPLLVAALLGAGCQEPDLETCRLEDARRPAYDEATGQSAFAGQAMLIQGCGGGAFCHSDGIDDADRFGAPHGLDLNLLPAAVDSSVDAAASQRLRRTQVEVLRERRQILASIRSGWMPPGGGVGMAVAEAAPRYLQVGTEGLEPLPALDSAEGREIVRNWLACDAPVVARPVPRDDGREAVGFVVPALDVEPLEPDWPDIYERLLVRRCNSSLCHGGVNAAGLNLNGQAEALDVLLTSGPSTTGEGAACGDQDLVLLEPGDPERSLFYLKLTSDFRCGDRMPLMASAVDDESLAAIRQWILDLGASP